LFQNIRGGKATSLANVVILFWVRLAVIYQKLISSDLVVDNINDWPDR